MIDSLWLLHWARRRSGTDGSGGDAPSLCADGLIEDAGYPRLALSLPGWSRYVRPPPTQTLRYLVNRAVLGGIRDTERDKRLADFSGEGDGVESPHRRDAVEAARGERPTMGHISIGGPSRSEPIARRAPTEAEQLAAVLGVITPRPSRR